MHYSKHAKSIIAVFLSMVFLASCKLPKYQIAQEWTPIPAVEQWRETRFGTQIYIASIEGNYGIKKYHLTGLLILKQLEDSTIRAVFQNEAGLTLFDFEWDKSRTFKTISIIKQMNKEPLILALKKDFEILMLLQLKSENSQLAKIGATTHYNYPLENGFVAYELIGNEIQTIKVYNNSKTYITFEPEQTYLITQLPQNIRLVHHKAKFTITLKALENYAPTE